MERVSATVKIVASYDPPSTFTGEPPSYRAASALTLTCTVEGLDSYVGLFYEWSSTCSGNCFTRGQTTRSVSTPYLHSYDTGFHTCMVYELDYTGNATISINVVGKSKCCEPDPSLGAGVCIYKTHNNYVAVLQECMQKLTTVCN